MAQELNISDAAKLICQEIDTYLWQSGISQTFTRSFRLDRIPNTDPMELLFKKLPAPVADGLTRPFEMKRITELQTKYDKDFVTILWGYCNSELENVIKLSKNTFAGDLWWIGRIAFSLGDKEDMNSIKNYFLQLLAPLAPLILQGEKPTDATGESLHFLARYCAWLHEGRRDSETPIPVRRFSALNMDEERVNANDACSVCGFDIRGRVKFCGGCTHPSFKVMNSVRFCGQQCMDAAWSQHKKVCIRRQTLFRAVEMFQAVADKFEVATFTGFSRSILYTDFHDKAHGHLFGVAPLASEKDLWIGASVFSEDAQKIIKSAKGAEHPGLLHYDMGADLYMQLKPLIHFTLNGSCEKFSIIHAYLRNAPDYISMGSDLNAIMKGKQPMFQPHPVLYFRLKGTKEDYVLDLHSGIFGWRESLISYKVFVQCRLAGIVKMTPIYEDDHAWADKEELGLRQARDEVLNEFKPLLRDFNKILVPDIGGNGSLWQICHVSEDEEFITRRAQILAFTDATLARITKRIRDEANYRLYFVYDANPYSHDFRYGVTTTPKDRKFYERVWMTSEQYEKDVAPYSPLKKGQDVEQTKKLAAMWMKRLDEVAATVAREQTEAEILAAATSQLDLAGEGVSAEFVARVRENFRKWQGHPDDEAESTKLVMAALDSMERDARKAQEAKEEAIRQGKESLEALEEGSICEQVHSAKSRHFRAMKYFEIRLAMMEAAEKKSG